MPGSPIHAGFAWVGVVERWVEWEIHPSPVGAAGVLTQTLAPWLRNIVNSGNAVFPMPIGGRRLANCWPLSADPVARRRKRSLRPFKGTAGLPLWAPIPQPSAQGHYLPHLLME